LVSALLDFAFAFEGSFFDLLEDGSLRLSLPCSSANDVNEEMEGDSGRDLHDADSVGDWSRPIWAEVLANEAAIGRGIDSAIQDPAVTDRALVEVPAAGSVIDAIGTSTFAPDEEERGIDEPKLADDLRRGLALHRSLPDVMR